MELNFESLRLKKSAIALAAKGWLILPVKEKIAAISKWRELATSDPDKLASLLQVKHTGIAIATGKMSDRTVVDVDHKDGVDGFETLRKGGIELPPTVCVVTPNDGRQYHYRYCPIAKTATAVLGYKSGIDIRNDGGYSVIPPSVLSSGRIYKWLEGCSPDEIEIAEFPQQLAEAIQNTPKEGDGNGDNKRKLLKVVVHLKTDPNLTGLFYNNLFTRTILYSRQPIWSSEIKAGKPLDDKDLVLIKHYLSEKHYLEVSIRLIDEAVIVVADQNKKHPVRDYLKSLIWDGTERLKNWLTVALGVVENPYTSCVGQKTLVAAVARVYEPGIKFDSMLILEGTQGIGKSTAVKTIGEPYYAAIPITDRDKDTVAMMQGVWIGEVEEMVCFRREDLEHVKAFLSRQSDKVRLAYRRNPEEFPRQSVLIGTLNPAGDNDYLRDQTGNRRFWPVRCTQKLTLEWLKENKDQLFAEAVVKYKAGEKLWIDDPKVLEMVRREQEIRQSKDPWTYPISRFLLKHVNVVNAHQVLVDCLGIQIGKVTKSDQTRVGIIMSRLGWKGHFDKELGCSVYCSPQADFVPLETFEKVIAARDITEKGTAQDALWNT